ncbi:MAG: UDP-2,4-diacetamido-2,4,6-trideoxy-beta-L-altropyranose hydrolase [Dongiaceae bacterium]
MFRAAWSETIGGGHLVRCSALADQLAELGWSVSFAADARAHMPIPGGIQYPITMIQCAIEDEPNFLRAVWPGGADLLVVDHMGCGQAFERACRPWARRILSIDGLMRAHDCDILLDPVHSQLEPAMISQLPVGCVTLLGPAHALLRDAFARRRQASLARRRASGRPKQILASFGAFDSHGLTELALRGLAIARPDAAIRVVMGGSADRVAAVRQLGADLGLNATVEGWTSDMASALADADIAIGNAGSATWERCCLGVPSVVVVAADNQRPIADLLRKTGAGLVVGDGPDTRPGDLAAAIGRLMDDRGFRKQVIESAEALCDGMGAGRVASLVTQRLAAAPIALNIR